MKNPDPPPTVARRRSRWAPRLFGGLLFLVVLVKCLHLSSMLMPFEGWDEYQHLAVADFLEREGRRPTPHDTVRPEMWSFLTAHPHPDHSARQLGGLGARNYDGKIWSGREWIRPGEASIPRHPPLLYEAQQGPLYYAFLIGLKRVFGLDSYLAWADAGRVANAFFAAITLVLWFVILRAAYRTCSPPILAGLVCTAVAANSLFIYDHARVANDTLANLLATATLAVYVLAVTRRGRETGAGPFAIAALLGGMTALTTLTKAFGLALIPVLVIAIPVVSWRRTGRPLPGLSRAGVFLAAYLLVAGPYHHDCLERHGTLTGMQESVMNRSAGKDMTAITGEVPRLLRDVWLKLFVCGQYNVGGWSWEGGTGSFATFHLGLLELCAGLIVVALLFRASRRRWLSVLGTRPELFAFLVVFWIALLYHAVHSTLAYGEPTTNAWYAVLVLPVLVLVLLSGAYALDWRVAAGVGAAFCGVWSCAHYKSVVDKMLTVQTHQSSLAEGLAVLEPHHAFLHFTGPGVIALEYALLALLLGCVVGGARSPTSHGAEQPVTGPATSPTDGLP